MPNELPLKLNGRTALLGDGVCANIEADSSCHSKVNDRFFGFDLWTHKFEDASAAMIWAEQVCKSCFAGIEYKINWR